MDSALKQRLLGATVLIALAIIFVPMFLSTSPPPSTTETMTLPVPPQRSFETRVLPVNDSPSSPPAESPPAAPIAGSDQVVTVDTNAPPRIDARPDDSSADQPPTSSSSPLPGNVAGLPGNSSPVGEKITSEKSTVPSVEKSIEKTPEKPSAISPPASNAPGRFMVNLGIYANHDHVVALIANMKKLGLTASAEPTEYHGKPAERVRIGPFADRAMAESTRLKIKQADAKIPTSVTEMAEPSTRPATAAITEATPKRAGGWAVQLGAFKSEEEANKLKNKMRNNGFSAFVDKINNGTQPLWRVRVGPEVERGNADKLRTTLKQKFQIDGLVVAHP